MVENHNLIDVIDENQLIEVPVDVVDTGDVVDDLPDLVNHLPGVVDDLPKVADKGDVEKDLEGTSI